MNRYLLPVFAALSLVPCAYGQGAPVSQTTRLQHIVAPEIPTSLKSAQGLDQLTVNFHDNSVTATGSSDAVAAFEKELHAADVVRAQYRIAMRLVRYHVDKQGKYVETSNETPILTDTDKTPASLSITSPDQGGYTLMVTPEGNTNGTVRLTVEVQELGQQNEVMSDGKNTQTVPLGKAVRITGMTDATDKPLRRSVQQGQIVLDHGEYTGCYVEVTPTLVTPPGHPSGPGAAHA